LSLKYGVLCLLTLFMIVLLAFKNFETWTAPSEAITGKTSPKKSSAKPEGPQPSGDQKDTKSPPSIASYILMAAKNPFHPERKEFPVIAPPSTPPVEPPPVRPQVSLYGVTIVGDYKSASISYPGRPLRKGEREVMTARIGDRIGQFQLVKILPDRIGLEHPKDSFEVLLYDTRTPKKRVAVKTDNKPAALTSTVPGPPDPLKPGGPLQPGVVQSGKPTPVTSAATPTPASPRSRRLFGSTISGTPETPGTE